MDEQTKVVKKYVALGLYAPLLVFYYFISKTYDSIYTNHDLDRIKEEAFQNLKNFGGFYLTGWNFSAQVYFLVVAIFDEISILLDVPTNIKTMFTLVRNYLFTAIVFPCTSLVCALFWFLYYLDRELVFPESLDEYYPPWISHIVHTFVMIVLVIEIALPKEKRLITIEFSKALPMLVAFLFIYQTSFLAIYFMYDIWLYPIFNYMSWLERMCFMGLLYTAAVFFLSIGICVRNLRQKYVK